MKNFLILKIVLIIIAFCLLVNDAWPDHHFFDGPGWFIQLRDAPPEHDYTGQAGRGFVVSGAVDGLVFSTLSGGGGGASNETVDCIVVYSGEPLCFSGNVICYTGSS
jgi:hypothetical protein